MRDSLYRIIAREAVRRHEYEVRVWAPAVGVFIDIGDRCKLTNASIPKKFRGCVFQVISFDCDGGTTLRVVER